MVESVSTYGNGWLRANNNDQAGVAERKNHGRVWGQNNTQRDLIAKNDASYSTFVEMLEDDNKTGNIDFYITDRTVNGKSRSKENGLSYLIGDMGMKLAQAGYLEDVDHQGFTAKNAKDLGVAIANEYGKNGNYLDRLFTKDGKKFTINKDVLIGLLEKAGWVRKKEEKPVQPEPQPVKPEPEVKPDVKPDVKPEVTPEPEGGDGRAIEVTNTVLTTILGLDTTKYADYKYVGFTKESTNGIDAFIFKLQKDNDVITIKKNADQIQELLKEHPDMKEQLIADELELDKADLKGSGSTQAGAPAQPEQPAGPVKPKKSDYYNSAILGGAFLSKEDKAKHDQGKIDYQWALAEYYDQIGDQEAAAKAVQKATELEGKTSKKKN